jgi:hypothetical protein
MTDETCHAVLAATNKSLVKSNKSRTGGEATKGVKSAREAKMSRRGYYLGGHTIYHGDPRGGTPIPDNRPKKIKNRERRERSERLYAEAKQDVARIAAERQALRRIEITGGDEVALGCKSSGWGEFKETLRAKLLFLNKANIRRANCRTWLVGSSAPSSPAALCIYP